MLAPNWKRAYARLMRMIAELESYGCEVIVPADFERPRPVLPKPRAHKL